MEDSALEQNALEAIAKISSPAELEAVRVAWLGKQGILTERLKSLGTLPVEIRKTQGQVYNRLKVLIETQLAEKKGTLGSSIASETRSDHTLPLTSLSGSIHPITHTLERVQAIFMRGGFDIADGPEIETDYYNFTALNIPQKHPARDMHDTFYTEQGNVLRTHTSPGQVRFMEKHKPPIRIVIPGTVYRCDPPDLTHTPMFHQLEGLYVDKGVSIAHLRGVLQWFLEAFFEQDVRIRMRSSYFPFTEPSCEVDVSCVMCNQKGCRVCKQSGWLEIMGCGMVHPEVLRHAGIDANEFSGFAFGMGIERLAMLRFGMADLRMFYENDVRFLRAFGC